MSSSSITSSSILDALHRDFEPLVGGEMGAPEQGESGGLMMWLGVLFLIMVFLFLMWFMFTPSMPPPSTPPSEATPPHTLNLQSRTQNTAAAPTNLSKKEETKTPAPPPEQSLAEILSEEASHVDRVLLKKSFKAPSVQVNYGGAKEIQRNSPLQHSMLNPNSSHFIRSFGEISAKNSSQTFKYQKALIEGEVEGNMFQKGVLKKRKTEARDEPLGLEQFSIQRMAAKREASRRRNKDLLGQIALGFGEEAEHIRNSVNLPFIKTTEAVEDVKFGGLEMTLRELRTPVPPHPKPSGKLSKTWAPKLD